MKHKHADTIIAWANGAEIEFRFPMLTEGKWSNWEASTLSWDENYEYRVKPAVVVLYGHLQYGSTLLWNEGQKPSHNIKATFDKATDNLLSIELLK